MANMNCFRAVLVFVILMSRWLNKSLCIDGTSLRSQFRLHSLAKDTLDFLARDTLDSFFQAEDSYRHEQASTEQNLQHSVGENNRSTNSNNVENLV